MGFENVRISTTRNGAGAITGYRQDLAEADVVLATLTDYTGVTTVKWELIGRPSFSAAGGGGPEPILLGVGASGSFVVDSDVVGYKMDGSYKLQATINPGSPGAARIVVVLARISGISIPRPGGGTIDLRKTAAFEAIDDTNDPSIATGYAKQENWWKEAFRQAVTGGLGGTTTLAGAYASGTSSGDQTLVLTDAHGGGLVVNAASGSYTGQSALRVVSAAGGPFVVDRATGRVGIGTGAPAKDVHVVASAPAVRLERTSGAALDVANVSDELQFLNGATVLAKMPPTGGVRADLGVGIGTAPATAAVLALGDGSAAAVSASGTARFRYNAGTGHAEFSENGGPYTPFGSPFSAYQTVANAGTSLTQRTVLNFSGGLLAVDNVGATRTDVTTLLTATQVGFGSGANTLTGDSLFAYDGTSHRLSVGAAIGGVATLNLAGAGTVSRWNSVTFNTTDANSTTRGTDFVQWQSGGNVDFEIRRLSGTTGLYQSILVGSYQSAFGTGASITFGQFATVGTHLMSHSGFAVDLGLDDARAGSATTLANAAASGFLYLPQVSGAPTGTPTNINGVSGQFPQSVPVQVDFSNSRLYAYLGGAWHYAAFNDGGSAPFYQTVANAGSSLTQRSVLNFSGGLVAVDNAGAGRTDVTTSLAAGQVGFGSAGNTLTGDSLFTYDGTNHRIGIGSTNPASSIADGTTFQLTLLSENQTVPHLRLQASANNTLATIIQRRKSRGTAAVPLVVQAADFAQFDDHRFFDGASWVTVLRQATFVQEGATPAGNSIPSVYAVQVNNGAGVNAGAISAPTEYAFRLDTQFNVMLGQPALATGSTDGFLYAPAVAGIPTGTPTNDFGSTAAKNRVGVLVDRADQRLYAYLNGAWHFAAFNDAASVYQTVQNAGSSLTQRTILNFSGGLVAVDNAGATRTDVTTSLTAGQLGFGSGSNTLTGSTLLTYDSTNKLVGIANVNPISSIAGGTSALLTVMTEATAVNVVFRNHQTAVAAGPTLQWRKSRGTAASPAAVVASDVGRAESILFYDGSGYVNSIQGLATVLEGATPTTGNVPSVWFLQVNGGANVSGTVPNRAQMALAVDTAFNVFGGSPALGTGSTDGYFYAPAVAGIPTGTPNNDYGSTAAQNRIPLQVDQADRRLYGYFGGAWHYAAFNDGGAAPFYQTVANAGSTITQRGILNFSGGLVAVDNAGAGRTDVTTVLSAGQVGFGSGSNTLTGSSSFLYTDTAGSRNARVIVNPASGGSPARFTSFRVDTDGTALTATTSNGLGIYWNGVESMDFIGTSNVAGTSHTALIRFRDDLNPGVTAVFSVAATTVASAALLVDIISSDAGIGKNGTLGTTDTTGFAWLPSVAGVPTGVPSSVGLATSGRTGVVFDTTDDRLYAYRSGWKAYGQFTGGLASGYLKNTTTTGLWSTSATIPASDVTGLFYQTVKNGAGTAQTQRGVLKFTSAFDVSDTGVETAVDLHSMISSGSGNNFSVDIYGRVTSYSTVAYLTQAYQTLQANGASVTQRSTASFSADFTVADNVGSARTDVGLANAGAGSGTYGGSGVSSVTLDSKGRVTAVGTATYLTQAYQTVQTVGSALTQRSTLNFSSSFTATDNGGSSRTDVDLANVGTAGTYGGTGKFIQALTTNSKGQASSVTDATGPQSSTYHWSIYSPGFSANGIMENTQVVVLPGDTGALLTNSGVLNAVGGGTVGSVVAANESTTPLPMRSVPTTYAGGGKFSWTMSFANAVGTGSATFEVSVWMTTGFFGGTYTQLCADSISLSAGADQALASPRTVTFSTTVTGGNMIFMALRRSDNNSGLTLQNAAVTGVLELTR